ncbi:MAG TPA: hypothetical protein VI278_15530 [Nitrososphaeraceae archaeon]
MSLFRIREDTIMPMVISSLLVVAIISSPSLLMGLPTIKTADAQANSTNNSTSTTNKPTITSSSHVDSSPVVAVFVITKDNKGNLIFLPNSATIRPGEEILVLNNDTRPQTVLNGKGTDDSMSGKLFSISAIKPKAFIEYGASNLQDGKYPFYLQSDPNVKGELTVVSSAKK